jgi:hypothetical protein
MLFDLKGKRRRVVQVVYLGLAILMGGGLVLFGIGGDVSGGLFDAFSERGGGGSNIVEDRVEDAEKRVAANPRDEAALKILVRDYYSLATDEADPNTGQIGEEGKDELRKSAQAWERYVKITERPDPALAQRMTEVYGPSGLNEAKKGQAAAQILAQGNESANSYLLLMQFALQAGDTRTADLAGQKAIDLAPRDQRSSVRDQVEQLKAAGAGAGAQGQEQE